MTWRLEVVHTTTYNYSAPVQSSYNEIRMTPITDLHQTTGTMSFTTEPKAPTRRYWDYWGTQVMEFDLTEPHERLMLKSSAVVETEDAAPPVRGATWQDLDSVATRDAHAELLASTPYTARDEELAEMATSTAAKYDDPVDAVLAVMAWVNESMTYQSGVTGVRTSAAEAWQSRQGVCQDFAHVALVVLRTMGVPARYVSGYLHSQKTPAIGVKAVGESHAWIEAWTGDWWGFDPTNNVEIGPRHVGVARGRDYADVAPVRGVHAGGGGAKLDVEVTLTRLR
jgi:transglutaminase-like putative cysteine protease